MTPAPAEPPRQKPIVRFLGGPPLWVIAKLVMASVLVGVVLAIFGLDALELVRIVEDIFYELFDNVWDALASLMRWFLLGAVIVVPIWLAARLLKTLGRG